MGTVPNSNFSKKLKETHAFFPIDNNNLHYNEGGDNYNYNDAKDDDAINFIFLID